MSLTGIAWSRNETEVPLAAFDNRKPQDLLKTALAAFVKWIPAEVVAAYGAFVAADWASRSTQANPTPEPSNNIWIWCLIAAPVFVVVLSLVNNNWPKLVRRAIFATIGFALWSASIPHSIWENADGFREGVGTTALVLLLGGTLVSWIGEWLLAQRVWKSDWRQIF